MSEPRFIHLRTHTAYSLLEGAIHVKALPGLARAAGMPAVAVTDSNNLFCALEFAEKAAAEGVQPIIGCQLALAFAAAPPGGRTPDPAPLVLLAQSEAGYRNLMALSSRAYLDAAGGLAHVDLATLCGHADGIICLSGGAEGPLGKLIAAGKTAEAEALSGRLEAAFADRYYIEIQRHGPNNQGRIPAEEATEPALVALAYARDLP
ncbi:MAG: PHP domain-containing protein, partial [Pseudomonadota bacterium]